MPRINSETTKRPEDPKKSSNNSNRSNRRSSSSSKNNIVKSLAASDSKGDTASPQPPSSSGESSPPEYSVPASGPNRKIQEIEGRTAELSSENKTVPAVVGSSREPAQNASVVASPVGSAMPEEQQHGDGDMVESFLRTLKGTRPELLRTSTFYEGAKHVYTSLAGLPVLRSIAPRVEAVAGSLVDMTFLKPTPEEIQSFSVVETVAESLVDMTPLKPTPEEQAERGSLAALDRKLMEAFSYVDEIFDEKKDDTIEGIVSMVGAVHSVVDVACSLGDGVNETVGGLWKQAWESAAGICAGAATTGNNVAKSAAGTADRAAAITSGAAEYVTATARNTVEGIKSAVGDFASAIGSSRDRAVSSIVGIFGKVFSYPISLVQTVLRTKDNEPPPEEWHTESSVSAVAEDDQRTRPRSPQNLMRTIDGAWGVWG